MRNCSTPWIWLMLWDGLLRCHQPRDGLPDPTEWCTFIACTVTGNSTLPTVLLPRFDNKHGIHKCSKLFLLVCWNGRPGFFNYEYFIRSYYCNVLLQYSSIPLWSAQGVSKTLPVVGYWPVWLLFKDIWRESPQHPRQGALLWYNYVSACRMTSCMLSLRVCWCSTAGEFWPIA